MSNNVIGTITKVLIFGAVGAACFAFGYHRGKKDTIKQVVDKLEDCLETKEAEIEEEEVNE